LGRALRRCTWSLRRKKSQFCDDPAPTIGRVGSNNHRPAPFSSAKPCFAKPLLAMAATSVASALKALQPSDIRTVASDRFTRNPDRSFASFL
jgi:hypothetical protein